MKAVHITYEVCPECKSPCHQHGFEISYNDKTIRRHVNGEIWEYVVFTCGRRDNYIPNMRGIETYTPCSNNVEQRERKQKRKEATAQVLKTIKSLDVDDDFRARLKRDYSYII
jgi:hypothetical protein